MSDKTDPANVPMEKIEIRDNVYQYYFVDNQAQICNSIFVCIDPHRQTALILDTAYAKHSEKVKADLAESKIKPEIVVLSHYHPDHVSGCPVFEDCAIYASSLYEDNYLNCRRWEPSSTFLRATHLLNDGDSLTFGPFQLKFIHAPGHCQCLLMTLIDDDLLHVGDMLMFSQDNKPTLPYIATGGGFKKHIDSLERIKTIRCNTLLVPHGYSLSDPVEITQNIDDRIHYLKRVLGSKGSLPAASCLKNESSMYANLEFHDNNLIQLLTE